MTRPMAAWRTTYTPGRWLALSGPNTLVVMAPLPTGAGADVNDLWLSVVGAGSLDALVKLVGEVGLDAVPDLGAFHWDDDGLHGLARGRVQVVDADTSEVVLSGDGSVTWREESLGRERRLGITLDEPGADESLQLPLVVGAACVSALVLTTDPSALVRFPTGVDEQPVPVPPVQHIQTPDHDELHEDPSAGEYGFEELDAGETAPADEFARPLGEQDSDNLEADGNESSPGNASLGEDGFEDVDAGESDRGEFASASEDRGFDDLDEGESADRSEFAPSQEEHGFDDHDADGFDAEVSYSAYDDDEVAPPRFFDSPSERSDRVDEASPAAVAPPIAGIPDGLPGIPAAPPVGSSVGAPFGQPQSLSSPVVPSAEPIVIPGDLGDSSEHDGGSVFGAGHAAIGRPDGPPERTEDPQVLAVPCTNGHANAPGSRTCRICQYPVDSAKPRLIRRPTLAGVHTNRGDFADIVTGVIVGRAPDPAKGPPRSYLMKVVSPGNDISRNHLLITTEGWEVRVTDLNSTNGTTVLPDGDPPFTLRNGSSVHVRIGTVLDLGDGVSLRIEPPRG